MPDFTDLTQYRQQREAQRMAAANNPASSTDSERRVRQLFAEIGAWKFMATLVPIRQPDGTISFLNSQIQELAQGVIHGARGEFPRMGLYEPRDEDVRKVFDKAESAYHLFRNTNPHNQSFTIESFGPVTKQFAKYLEGILEAKVYAAQMNEVVTSPEGMRAILDLDEAQWAHCFSSLLCTDLYLDALQVLCERFGGDNFKQLAKMNRNAIVPNELYNIKNVFDFWESKKPFSSDTLAKLSKGMAYFLSDFVTVDEKPTGLFVSEGRVVQKLVDRLNVIHSDNYYKIDEIDIDEIDIKVVREGDYSEGQEKIFYDYQFLMNKYSVDYQAACRLKARINAHIREVDYLSWKSSPNALLKNSMTKIIHSEFMGEGAEIILPVDDEPNNKIIELKYGVFECSVNLGDSSVGRRDQIHLSIKGEAGDHNYFEYPAEISSIQYILAKAKDWLENVHVGIDFERLASFVPTLESELGYYEYAARTRQYLRQAVDAGIIPNNIKFTVAKGFRDVTVTISGIPDGLMIERPEVHIARRDEDYELLRSLYKNGDWSYFTKSFSALHSAFDRIVGCERVCTDDGDHGSYPVLHNYSYDIKTNDKLDAVQKDRFKEFPEEAARKFIFDPCTFKATDRNVESDFFCVAEGRKLDIKTVKEVSGQIDSIIGQLELNYDQRDFFIGQLGNAHSFLKDLLKYKLPTKKSAEIRDELLAAKNSVLKAIDSAILHDIERRWKLNNYVLPESSGLSIVFNRTGENISSNTIFQGRNKQGIPYLAVTEFSAKINMENYSFDFPILKNEYLCRIDSLSDVVDRDCFNESMLGHIMAISSDQLNCIETFANLGIISSYAKYNNSVPYAFADQYSRAVSNINDRSTSSGTNHRFFHAVKRLVSDAYNNGEISDIQRIAILAQSLSEQVTPMMDSDNNVRISRYSVSTQGRISLVEDNEQLCNQLFNDDSVQSVLRNQPMIAISDELFQTISDKIQAFQNKFDVLILEGDGLNGGFVVKNYGSYRFFDADGNVSVLNPVQQERFLNLFFRNGYLLSSEEIRSMQSPEKKCQESMGLND